MRTLASLAALTFLVGSLTAQVIDPARNAFVATQDPLGEPVSRVVYLEQNWSPDQSMQFYFTSQGSQIVPYDWFLALEQPDSAALFRDNQNILKYRYLAQNPGPTKSGWTAGGIRAGQGDGAELAGNDVRGLPHGGDPAWHDRVPRRWWSDGWGRPGIPHRSDACALSRREPTRRSSGDSPREFSARSTLRPTRPNSRPSSAS